MSPSSLSRRQFLQITGISLAALRTGAARAKPGAATPVRILADAFQCAGGVCNSGWYAGVLVIEHTDSKEKGSKTDYEGEKRRAEAWGKRFVNKSRRLKLVTERDGNTAETVLSLVKCGVITVKPKGFISPVTVDVRAKAAA